MDQFVLFQLVLVLSNKKIILHLVIQQYLILNSRRYCTLHEGILSVFLPPVGRRSFIRSREIKVCIYSFQVCFERISLITDNVVELFPSLHLTTFIPCVNVNHAMPVDKHSCKVVILESLCKKYGYE